MCAWACACDCCLRFYCFIYSVIALWLTLSHPNECESFRFDSIRRFGCRCCLVTSYRYWVHAEHQFGNYLPFAKTQWRLIRMNCSSNINLKPNKRDIEFLCNTGNRCKPNTQLLEKRIYSLHSWYCVAASSSIPIIQLCHTNIVHTVFQLHSHFPTVKIGFLAQQPAFRVEYFNYLLL